MHTITKTVRRTWRERLTSRPFLVATKQVRDHEAERLRDMVQNWPMVSAFEMRSSTRTRVPPRVPVTSSVVRHSDDVQSSQTDDNYLTGALVGYALGSITSHPAPAATAQAFMSGGGGDFGGGGASASWGSSDSSSCSSSSSESSSSSSSDSGSCSSSD